MKIILEVNTREDAKLAIQSLKGYIGDVTEDKPKTTVKKEVTEDKPKTTVKKEVTEDKPEKETSTDDSSKKEGITLEILTARAKEKVKEFSRSEVKDVISKFGSALSKVDEADYGKLYKRLGEM